MAYEPQEWRNGIEGNTPTSAKRFTHIEDGIAGVDDTIRGTQDALDNWVGITARAERTITAGDGLTGGGDLSDDRELAADFGDESGTVCEGDDPRLANNRTPEDGSVTHAKLAQALKTLVDKAMQSEQITDVVVLTASDYADLGSNADPAIEYHIIED